MLSSLGMMNYRMGRIEKAVAFWEQSRAFSPDFVPARVSLVFHYETTGNPSEARELIGEILRANSQFSVRDAGPGRLLSPNDPAPYFEALRAAGLPYEPQPSSASDRAGRPGIAVLPFCNLSNDPDQEYFADGVTEDLTAVLSRSPDLLVISRSSSSRYDCEPPDLKQVGRELGVRYAVEGSVRRAQDRVRITAQLIDATTDVHLWSESYERDLTPANVFDIQLDIAQQIANALQVQLVEWEGQRRPPTRPPGIFT